MGVCKYCGVRIIRISATKCKKCFDQVFRYVESYTWFRFTEMDKEEYFHELMKMAVSETLQKHFHLESKGQVDSLELSSKEIVLLVMKNVTYTKENMFKDASIGKVKRDTGNLVVTNKRLIFLGGMMKITKDYSAVLDIEEHDELGIKIPTNYNVGNRTVKLYQYFSPCVEEIYFIQKIWEYSVAGRDFLEGLGKYEKPSAFARYRVKKPASIIGVRKETKDNEEAV